MKVGKRPMIILIVSMVAIVAALALGSLWIANRESKNLSDLHFPATEIPDDILVRAREHISKKENSEQFELLLENTKKYEFGWIFFYASKRFIETGNSDYNIPGTSPFVVATDGSVADLSSSISPEDAIEEYRLLENQADKEAEYERLTYRAYSAKPYPPEEQAALLKIVHHLRDHGENPEEFYIKIRSEISTSNLVEVHLLHQSVYGNYESLGGGRLSQEIEYNVSSGEIERVTYAR